MIAGVFLLVGGLAAALVGGTISVAAATVSRVELSRWVSNRLRGAAVASRLYDAPVGTLRAANAVGAIGALMAGLGLGALLANADTAPALAAVVLVGAPLVGVVGYGLPRAVGRRWSESVVARAAPLTHRFLKMLPGRRATSRNGELLVTGAVHAEGLTTTDAREQARMISGVLAFTARQVKDVMTPRTAIIALEDGASLADVAQTFTESGYSRIPVYSGTLDEVIGMIHAFDLLKVTPGSELPIRPMAETPGSNLCSALLLELQRDRRQMAVVLDEFGGTAGIVTLEDLMEDLVGEIFDDDEPVEPGDEASIIELPGSAPTDTLQNQFGLTVANGAETVGGFLAHLAGRIPQAGEHLRYGLLEFDVIEATPMRVERVVVRRGPIKTTVIGGGPQ